MIVGLILAGGRSERFGAEKALARLDGRPLIAIAEERLAADCFPVAVSAREGSGAEDWAKAAGLPVLHDAPDDANGPLAGVKAGLVWARAMGATHMATLPCDTPHVPADITRRLLAGMGAAFLAVAETEDGLHPLCGLWRVEALAPLILAMDGGAHPPVRAFADQIGGRRVRFPDPAAFANINRPQDLGR
jgi:molybdopterin-guanine dinucleotide biosynthesis protein A